MYQLRKFLAFAVGAPVRLLSARGIIDPEPDDSANDSGEGRTFDLEILFRPSNNPDASLPARPRMTHEMLFTRANAQPRLTEVLNAWWKKEALLRPVFDLYFGTIFSPGAYSEHRFLSYAQALETYHRRTDNRTQLPKDVFKSRRTLVLDAMPTDETRKWLGDKLAFANELPLRERVEEVLQLCPPATKRIVGTTKADRTSFVALTVDTRNYRTHYTSKLEKKAARGIRLFRLAYQLQLLLETALLHELGFASDEIVPMLERTRRFEYLGNIRAAEVREFDDSTDEG